MFPPVHDEQNVLPGPPQRAQFILGPTSVEKAAWRAESIDPDTWLSYHQDLGVTRSDDSRLVVIGTIIDWRRPEADDREVINALAASSNSIDELLRNTSELGGRWVVVAKIDCDSVLLHDACGLRQVCYGRRHTDGSLWCASQPDLLSEVTGSAPNPEAIDFVDAMSSVNPEYWLPGDRLPLEDSVVLLPNHMLDLSTGRATRYWPISKRPPLGFDEAVSRTCQRLQGMVTATARRSDIVLGLSAGLDSRLMLAAARDVMDQLAIYNVIPSGADGDLPDVAVPRRLCRELGLEMTPVDEPEAATSEFLEGFRQHCWRARDRFAAGIESQFNNFRGTSVAIIGNVAEVAKVSNRHKYDDPESVSTAEIAAGAKMGGYEFAEAAISDWRQSVDESLGYHLLDLFQWEQRVGRWLAANQVEFDYGWKDIVVPLNSRALLSDLLSVEESDRGPPDYRLFRAMIRSMWPELLDYPINPKDKPGRLRRLRRRLKALVTA